MASLTRMVCPCGCGATTATDSDMATAWRQHWPCDHVAARATCAPGVRYCHDCWHWLGTRAAFESLHDDQDPERWIFTDAVQPREEVVP